MFDVLVESTSQRRGARMWAYFAVSSVVWLGIFAGVAIAGVMAYDARLDAEFDDLGLIAYVPEPAPPIVERARSSSAPPQTNALVSRPEAPDTIAPVRTAPPAIGPSTIGVPDGGNNGEIGGIPGANGTTAPGLPYGSGPAGPVTPIVDPPPEPAPEPEVQTPRAPVSKGPLNGIAIHKVTPPYPEMAKRAGVGGEVVVTVTVSEEGVVTSANVLRGQPLLNAAAVRAAYGWRFTPTMLGGKPVRVVGTITFNFKKS